MNRTLLLLFLGMAFTGSVAQQIEWQRCFGGTGFDGCESVQQTADGGYILAGYSESNDGDVTGNHGDADYWVVKLDRSGAMDWQKSLGGSFGDWGRSVVQTDDGGYIVAGHVVSFDGDVSCNNGLHDFWIAKLDSSGSLQWERCFGGGYEEEAHEIMQTSDGGYIVAGSTISNNGIVSGNHGWHDFWVLKLDATGNFEWQRCYGGTENEKAFAIDQATDGGYVVAGHAWSNDGDVLGNNGGIDSWVIRIDSVGNLLWQRCLGGSSSEYAHDVKATADGGFIVASSSHSNDGDVVGNHGGGDCWIVKLDSLGGIIWQQCFGGSYLDFGKAVQQTQDGGYIIAANSESLDGDVSVNYGYVDFWMIKLDPGGQMEWEESYGGSHYDAPYSVRQTIDNGFVVAGVTSSNNFHVNGNNGSSDFWVLKLSDSVITTSVPDHKAVTFQMYPNPARDAVTIAADEPVTGVTLFDMAGNELDDLPFSGVSHSVSISVTRYVQGMYLVRVQAGKHTSYSRLVRH